MKRKFVVGQIYDFPDWVTQEIYRYTVTEVTEKSVWFDVKKPNSSSEGSVMVEKIIFKDDDDSEYVFLYKLDNIEARITAYIV